MYTPSILRESLSMSLRPPTNRATPKHFDRAHEKHIETQRGTGTPQTLATWVHIPGTANTHYE